jgi:hypothetical protein
MFIPHSVVQLVHPSVPQCPLAVADGLFLLLLPHKQLLMLVGGLGGVLLFVVAHGLLD